MVWYRKKKADRELKYGKDSYNVDCEQLFFMSLKGEIKSNPFSSQEKKKKERNSLNVWKALAKSKENLVYKFIVEKSLRNPTEGVF